MDGTWPSFASRVLASPTRYESTSLFVLPNAAAGPGLLLEPRQRRREDTCPLSAGRWRVAGKMQSSILHMKLEEISRAAAPAMGALGEGGGHVLADDWRRVWTSRNKQTSFRNPVFSMRQLNPGGLADRY